MEKTNFRTYLFFALCICLCNSTTLSAGEVVNFTGGHCRNTVGTDLVSKSGSDIIEGSDLQNIIPFPNVIGPEIIRPPKSERVQHNKGDWLSKDLKITQEGSSPRHFSFAFDGGFTFHYFKEIVSRNMWAKSVINRLASLNFPSTSNKTSELNFETTVFLATPKERFSSDTENYFEERVGTVRVIFKKGKFSLYFYESDVDHSAKSWWEKRNKGVLIKGNQAIEMLELMVSRISSIDSDGNPSIFLEKLQ